MPLFTSAAQTSRNTINSKLARRAEALKHAPVFSADEHQKFLNATGQSTCGAAFQPLLMLGDAQQRRLWRIFKRKYGLPRP